MADSSDEKFDQLDQFDVEKKLDYGHQEVYAVADSKHQYGASDHLQRRLKQRHVQMSVVIPF